MAIAMDVWLQSSGSQLWFCTLSSVQEAPYFSILSSGMCEHILTQLDNLVGFSFFSKEKKSVSFALCFSPHLEHMRHVSVALCLSGQLHWMALPPCLHTHPMQPCIHIHCEAISHHLYTASLVPNTRRHVPMSSLPLFCRLCPVVPELTLLFALFQYIPSPCLHQRLHPTPPPILCHYSCASAVGLYQSSQRWSRNTEGLQGRQPGLSVSPSCHSLFKLPLMRFLSSLPCHHWKFSSNAFRSKICTEGITPKYAYFFCMIHT